LRFIMSFVTSTSVASGSPEMTATQVVPPASRADRVYVQLRDDIFEMRLLPGDRITEASVAERFEVSRTPAREALQRLQSDGLMQGYVRGGWEVVPIDFKRFDDLYEMRELLETFAVRKICSALEHPASSGAARVASTLDALAATWKVPPKHRIRDGRALAALDEAFHQALVDATGNEELMSAMRNVTDRIRIVRRLDFVYGDCCDEAYEEHAAILGALHKRDAQDATRLLEEHIRASCTEVRKLTVHRLQDARTNLAPHALPPPRSGKRRTI
jgi:DNA-binding GntR family transcriptional regulator